MSLVKTENGGFPSFNGLLSAVFFAEADTGRLFPLWYIIDTGELVSWLSRIAVPCGHVSLSGLRSLWRCSCKGGR